MPARSLNTPRDFPGPAIVPFGGLPTVVNPLLGGGVQVWNEEGHWTFGADGSIVSMNGGTVVVETQKWADPVTVGVGNSFWIRATPQDSTLPTGSDVNVWIPLSSDVTWSQNTNGMTATLLVEIAADSIGASIVTSGTYTIDWV